MPSTISQLLQPLLPPPTNSPQFIKGLKTAVLVGIFFSLTLTGLDKNFIATLALGVIGAGLADNTELYRSRAHALGLLIACFSLASLSVTLLYPWPILFVVGLFSSTFLFVMLAAFGQGYGSITLSSLIIAVYTMLGYQDYMNPWIQPILLLLGALSYFTLSTLIQKLFPENDLEHQNEQLYALLAKYQLSKARFFMPGTDLPQLRLSLAEQSASIAQALVGVRQQLVIRQYQNANANQASGFLDQFFKAQLILERLTSSHIRYQEISDELATTSLPLKIRQVMVGLSRRLYRQPHFRKALDYEINDQVAATITSLEKQIGQLKEANLFSSLCVNQLGYLIENLKTMEQITRRRTPFPTENFQFDPIESLGIKDFLRQCVTPNTPLFHHAFRQALCMSLGYLAVQLAGGESQHYWLLLTTLLITKPNYSATKQRLLQRVAGTIIGIFFAATLTLIAMPQLITILLCSLSILAFFWYFQKSYSIAVIMVTVFVSLMLSIQGGDSYQALIIRVEATLIGSMMVYVALRWIWPDWQRAQSKPIIKKLFHHLVDYQYHIMNQYYRGQYTENKTYRMARFHAHVATSKLVNHWQAMLADPQSKRQESTTLYQLTGRIHAYLSHLSALAAHRDRIKKPMATDLVVKISELQVQGIEEIMCYLQSERHGSCSFNPIAERINQKLHKLIPNLVGEELLIAFQLQQLSYNLKQIQVLITEETHW